MKYKLDFLLWILTLVMPPNFTVAFTTSLNFWHQSQQSTSEVRNASKNLNIKLKGVLELCLYSKMSQSLTYPGHCSLITKLKGLLSDMFMLRVYVKQKLSCIIIKTHRTL